SDLADHPKADCIYSKLSQTKTLKNLIVNFKGDDSKFDLVIKVDNIDGLGALLSSPNSNTFIMKFDQVNILQRKSILTAVTFMHEAIHAEMRRFLSEYQDVTGSTLPGFPGDFATDWSLYVDINFGGNIEAA